MKKSTIVMIPLIILQIVIFTLVCIFNSHISVGEYFFGCAVLFCIILIEVLIWDYVSKKKKQKEEVVESISYGEKEDEVVNSLPYGEGIETEGFPCEDSIDMQPNYPNEHSYEPAQEVLSTSNDSAETVKAHTPESVDTVKADSAAGYQEPVSQGGCLPVGTMLQDGRYKVVRYLASGGFGNTYLIEHTRLGTLWAMKEFFMRGVNARVGTTVSVSLSENRDVFLQMKDKFLKEAKRISSLKNGHIVELIDFFEENGTAYYVMRYVEGKSLSATMKENNAPLTENEVRSILPQVLDALRCIHEHQLFHLDLKPGNIMLDADGHVCLIDFGASKQMSAADNRTLSTTGLSYTPGYAPSEQISGNMKRIGPWTDFYALGATLYNLLTNSTPPEENDIMYDGEKAFNFGSMTPEMQALILHLMNPRYDQRPQSVDEIVF